MLYHWGMQPHLTRSGDVLELRVAASSNPSFNRTRYGKRRKPGPRHMVHHREPGLRRLPPRAG